MHNRPCSETASALNKSLEWRPNPPITVARFDIRTGSALGAASAVHAIAAMDIVVDMAGSRITLTSSPGFSGWQFVDFGDLHPAVAAARAYLTGERKTWEVFAIQGGERTLIGGIEASERKAEEGVLTNPTEVVSQLPFRSSVVQVNKTTREAFNRLASDWKQTRNRYSSGIDIFVHASYQKIIGMGEKVLPLIFEELHRELDHWFWALKAITQVDPVPSEDVGNLGAMRNHWLAWATQHGYQWQPNYTRTRSVAESSLH